MLRPNELYGTYVDGDFVPPAFDVDLWSDFLAGRGVEIGSLRDASPALGGLVNANYRITAADGSVWFLRWYRQRSIDAVLSELDVVSRLAATGFPTPAPVTCATGTTATEVLGWPAVLFPFVEGVHPPAGPHATRLRTLALAFDVAEAAGSLGARSLGWEMAGARRAAPKEMVERFVSTVHADQELAALAGMSGLVDQLSSALAAFDRTAPEGLPSGVVHGDLHEQNVLADADDRLLWVLDFDDARSVPLIFELVALFPYWARAGIDALDPEAVGRLVATYGQARPLTGQERACLAEAALLLQASEACSHLTHHLPRLRAGSETLEDSYSVALFRGMHEDRSWRHALGNG